MGEVRLNGGKSGQMVFQTRAGLQNHAIGWLRTGCSSLGGGSMVRFSRVGGYLGNVGLHRMQYCFRWKMGLHESPQLK